MIDNQFKTEEVKNYGVWIGITTRHVQSSNHWKYFMIFVSIALHYPTAPCTIQSSTLKSTRGRFFTGSRELSSCPFHGGMRLREIYEPPLNEQTLWRRCTLKSPSSLTRFQTSSSRREGHLCCNVPQRHWFSQSSQQMQIDWALNEDCVRIYDDSSSEFYCFRLHLIPWRTQLLRDSISSSSDSTER